MWPITNCRTFKSPALNEFVRRYREHLATLPPDRLKLFEAEELDCRKRAASGALAHDWARTVKEFQRDVVASNANIQEVRPGVSKHQFFISVILRPGVDPKACALPEFFRGYMVDLTPQPVLRPKS